MKKTAWFMLFLLASIFVTLLSSCAPSRRPVAVPVVEKLPYQFRLEFSSRLPDDFYSTRGPIDSYHLYHVNDQLRERLQKQLAARSGVSGPEVVVRVELVDLKFDYEEIGGGMTPPTRSMIASARLLPGMISQMDNDDGGGVEIPYETVKTAIVRFSVSLEGGGVNSPASDHQETVIEKVMGDDLHANWPEDYHSFDKVIDGSLARVVAVVDGLLVENYAGRKN